MLLLYLLKELDVGIHVVISDNFTMSFSSDGYFLKIPSAVIKKMKKTTMILLDFNVYFQP